jgi:hypothetical protein
MTQSALSWFLIGLTGSHIRAFPKAAALDSKITQLISFHPKLHLLPWLNTWAYIRHCTYLREATTWINSKPCIAMLPYCAGNNTKQLQLSTWRRNSALYHHTPGCRYAHCFITCITHKRNERMLVPVAFNITLTHITQESHNSSAHIASALREPHGHLCGCALLGYIWKL